MKKFMLFTMLVMLITVIICLPAFALDGQSGPYTYTVKKNGDLCITKFDWKSYGEEDVYIPRFIDGYVVTEIGERAFTMSEEQYHRLHRANRTFSVILPDSLTSIREFAFYQTQISSIHIPSSVQIIGNGAFRKTAIREFSVSSENQAYATINGVLYNKKEKELIACPSWGMKSLDIPNGIRSIAPYAFTDVNINNVVTYPTTLTTIKPYAFYDSTLGGFLPTGTKTSERDVEVIISGTISSIGEYCFSSSHIYNVEVPNYGNIDLSESQITEIPNNAFSNMNNVHKITLPQHLVSIEKEAFYNTVSHNSFISLHIPPSVVSIGDSAFAQTEKSGIEVFFDLSQISKLQSIGERAFYNALCSHRLSDRFHQPFILRLPYSLKSIGANAFTGYYKPDTALVIPASVSEIGDDFCDRDNKISAEDGSYAYFWAINNGYTIINPHGDDTSWLEN